MCNWTSPAMSHLRSTFEWHFLEKEFVYLFNTLLYTLVNGYSHLNGGAADQIYDMRWRKCYFYPITEALITSHPK